MSFSAKVKRQIVAQTAENMDYGPEADCCMWAETCGLLLYSTLLTGARPSFRTEDGEVAHHIAELLSVQLGMYIDISILQKAGKESAYTVRIPQERQKNMAWEALVSYAASYGFETREKSVDADTLGACITASYSGQDAKKDGSLGAFLRGVFIAAGTVAEPEKSYCLEFVVPGEKTRDKLMKLLSSAEVRCGFAVRRGKNYVYIHDSGSIETVLATVGAGNAYFELVDIKLMRELRNDANRRRNCDDANITKTVHAAALHVDAIKKIDKKIGLNTLPPDLCEIARLRLENPYMSLRELGELLSEPLSRSGVNHRLRRVMEIAEGITEDAPVNNRDRK